MTIYVATTNAGKLRDFAAAAVVGVSLLPLPGLDTLEPPAEDELTFVGNARLKAIFYSQHAPGLLIMADDSGIAVDALEGAPGVRSARYAEDSGFISRRPLSADQKNNLCLLDALCTTREEARGAHYRCALAVARDGEVLSTAEGTVDGEIVAVPRGNSGFGYDPLFLLPELGLTMGEISATERQQYSHRARALSALLRDSGPIIGIAQT